VKIAEIWTEHFREVLNQEEPTVNLHIPEPQDTLDIFEDPPMYSEVFEIIGSLKRGKAPGVDNIPAEFLQCNTETIASVLHILFGKIWREEHIPDDWRRGLIIKLPKKGNLAYPNNWRGITLLPVISKIFLKIIHLRIATVFEEQNILDDEQAGFRAGKSCTDHIFTLRNILEQCQEWRFPLYVNFIDFSKAFDSLHRDKLWKILEYYGIPTKLISLIRIFYDNYKCSVKQQGAEAWFDVKTGVRQGCVISPFLFIIATDFIMKRISAHNTGAN
jgi:hypothetical protein